MALLNWFVVTQLQFSDLQFREKGAITPLFHQLINHPLGLPAAVFQLPTSTTWTSPGPCIPVTRRNSMSPVLLGPRSTDPQGSGRQLGIPDGSVASRLAKARVILAKRLTQRGVVFSGGSVPAAVLSAAGVCG
jgi:hypothetical protein